MTNRFTHEGWATKQPLDLCTGGNERCHVQYILMFILEGMAVERAWGFGFG